MLFVFICDLVYYFYIEFILIINVGNLIMYIVFFYLWFLVIFILICFSIMFIYIKGRDDIM